MLPEKFPAPEDLDCVGEALTEFPVPEDLDCVGKALTEFSICNEDEVKQVGAKKKLESFNQLVAETTSWNKLSQNKRVNLNETNGLTNKKEFKTNTQQHFK